MSNEALSINMDRLVLHSYNIPHDCIECSWLNFLLKSIVEIAGQSIQKPCWLWMRLMGCLLEIEVELLTLLLASRFPKFLSYAFAMTDTVRNWKVLWTTVCFSAFGNLQNNRFLADVYILFFLLVLVQYSCDLVLSSGQILNDILCSFVYVITFRRLELI